MAIHALHHVNLRAPADELRALRDFYCDVVGLYEGERPPFKSAGFWLYADGAPILHLSTASTPSEVPASGAPRSLLNHIAFRCTDLDATLARLRSHGIAFSVTEVPDRGEKQIQFQDPSGTGVELSFPAPIGTTT